MSDMHDRLLIRKIYKAIDEQNTEALSRLLIRPGYVAFETIDELLKIAAYKGFPGVIETLVCFGAVVNHSKGYAIRIAAKRGHLQAVKTLLELGADPSFFNNEALQRARRAGHKEIVEVLQNATV